VKYRILGPALEDLRNIEDWVVAEFGELAALRARRRLFEAFELLTQFQQMGRVRPEVVAAPIRFFAQPPNWIAYRPGDPLLIHRVFPARTDIRDFAL
jgi:plasmid stabilization system protein ParE